MTEWELKSEGLEIIGGPRGCLHFPRLHQWGGLWMLFLLGLVLHEGLEWPFKPSDQVAPLVFLPCQQNPKERCSPMHQNLQSTVVLPTEVFEVRDDAQPKNQLERPGAKEGDVNLGSWFPGRSSSQNGKNRGRGTDDNVFFRIYSKPSARSI